MCLYIAHVVPGRLPTYAKDYAALVCSLLELDIKSSLFSIVDRWGLSEVPDVRARYGP
jgi:hypothetical protein